VQLCVPNFKLSIIHRKAYSKELLTIVPFIKYSVRTYYHAILFANPQNIKAPQLEQHEAKQVASLRNDEVLSCCYQPEYTSLQLT
jgi:hypothetical protein